MRFSKPHGLYSGGSVTVEIEGSGSGVLRYTTDGSEPTSDSPMYEKPLTLRRTTMLRAVEVWDDSVSASATATYLFLNSVLNQDNSPAGYPSEWGDYTQIWGTAKADYEMDPEMTGDPTLRQKIAEGLKSLPIVSIVTDRDNLFSHENDPDRGGIYIFTGPPVGDGTGHGWTRPASVELIWPDGAYGISEFSETSETFGKGFSVNCGLRLHGGHGRLAEKNPKHSFRLVFKEKYGPKTLKYPLFGDGEPKKFDQLVLRCHFGNAWQHWDENNRRKAQYTRDVWARRMQRRMGRTSVNALYVNLFLNGMYWGLYNIAERVDDQYGKDHLGGEKGDIDVIKVEEDGGNHIEAAEGDLTAWEEMTATAFEVGGMGGWPGGWGMGDSSDSDAAYFRLQGRDADGNPDPALEPLLDIDAFIDYMLINQYGGNTDWDHHNWYAIRRRGADSQGFRFLCWDSELIIDNVRENVLNKDNGYSYPTGIFQSLMRNEKFARRYFHRAKKALASDGVLGYASAVELWDSLHDNIASALYAEAARWGDYRRDVHRYTAKGQLYTVDNQYETERQRLLTQYFPYRSETVLKQIKEYVDKDVQQTIADRAVDAAGGNDVILDLLGRQTKHPQKGVYIRNRKKIVIE